MAGLTTAISIQIDKEDKEKATEILQKLGVSMSGLINMTIKQLIMRKSIPFEVAIPKEEQELSHYFTEEELDRTAKELAYMEKHPEKYNSYNNIGKLKEALLSDD
ncbi:MAG: type II toxin-antitoxin system RelB/DinJ family antitoxin [Bacilli bacterium]|nr:type II toxin-antitoxin system RelB/DinJ family antitoxin [Bacilli bacterium]